MKTKYLLRQFMLCIVSVVAATSVSAQQAGDEVYQIGNAEEFVKFGALVAQGADSINGALTADIDFTGVSWTPIGSGDRPYRGHFNGNFHRIKNLVINSTEDYQGLFGYISSASISNLFIDSSCSISGGSYVAGIAGGGVMGGTAYFTNCGNEASITATGANAAGIVGVSMASAVKFIIKNCYNGGNINGGRESAAICGWCAGTAEVDGVLNIGALTGSDGENNLVRSAATLTNAYDINGGQGIRIDAEAMASGALAYALNGYKSAGGIWCQNIDAEGSAKDGFPVPDTVHHAKVYAAGALRCDSTVYPSQVYTNTFTVPEVPAHDYIGGICEVCGLLEPGFVPMKDGVYEVGSADQLNWVAQAVNRASDRKFYVLLTEDIDFSAYTSKGVVIGIDGHEFQGSFDGQGHTVNIDFETDHEFVSLFRRVRDAEVKNLITEGTVSSSAKYASGIIAQALGATRIVNCISKVNIVCSVSGDATCGGIVGKANAAGKIINCGFIGSIVGDNCGCNGGIVGWSDEGSMSIDNCFVAANLQAAKADLQSMVFGRNNPVLTNCYYTDAGKFTPDAGTTRIEEEGVATGMLCYALNTKADSTCWFQNLDNGDEADEYPVPFITHAVVYPTGSVHCDGTPSEDNGYSNTEGQIATLPHDFREGVCSFCHKVLEDYMQPVDGYYELRTPGELNWFARMVNLRKENAGMNARLMNDIDFSEYTERDSVMIGVSNMVDYAGTFDGGGHKITINYVTYSIPAALFRTANNASVRNLYVTGRITQHSKYAGSFFYWCGHTTLENCVSDVNIECDLSGDATIGGLAATTDSHTTIRNCAFYGTINAPNAVGNGGIVGWSGAGRGEVMENCIVDAEMNVAEGDNYLIARNNPTVANCYYVDPGKVNLNVTAQEVDASQLSSGEVAFLLNGYKNAGIPWVQNIGTDTCPYPTGDRGKVYAIGTIACEGALVEATYSNTEGELTVVPHSYDADGICTTCGARLISTPAQLLAAANDFNNGYTNVNMPVKLAADIEMSGITDYAGIGTETIPYAGHFDGQGHVINNLKIDNDLKYQGLINMVDGGAVIENVIMGSTSAVKCNSYAAGIVAASSASSNGIVTIRNCGNEAAVTVDAALGVNAGGVFGSDLGNSSLIRISNCYNTGDISGHAECAGLSGWVGNYAEVKNCYSTGKVTGLDGANTFLRAAINPYITNCYETTGSQVNNVTDEQVTGGALCYMLNGNVQGGEPYYQTLGSDLHPVLFTDHGKVFEMNGAYTNDLNGIDETRTAPLSGDGREHIYSSDGVEIHALHKGINIVREADGSVRKVLVK